MVFYLILLIFLFVLLMSLDKSMFNGNKTVVSVVITIYFICFFGILNYSNCIQYHDHFNIFDGLLFIPMFFLVLFRFKSIPLIKQRDLIEFEVIYRVAFLGLFFYFLGFKSIKVVLDVSTYPPDWAFTLILTGMLVFVDGFCAIKLNYLVLKPKPLGLKNLFVLGMYMFCFVSLTQEIFFRGMIFHYLHFLTQSLMLSLLLSSLIFGLAHVTYGGWKMVGLASVAGLVYGFIYWKTNNIFFPVVCHGLTNLLWKFFLQPTATQGRL